MAMADWREEVAGDPSDLVETEWDAELSRRLSDVADGSVALVDHTESMRAARQRLASRGVRRSVALGMRPNYWKKRLAGV